MAIKLKKPHEIDKMRQAGRIVRLVLDRLGEMIAPGITTEELDAQAEELCHSQGGKCLFKGVPGSIGVGPFPGNICASIDEQVVHGIPSGRKLSDGEIISVDFGVELDGWCGDAAETFAVGNVPPETMRLLSVTKESLSIAVRMIKPRRKWSEVARAMQTYVEGEGFSVVTDFVGHGIGKDMHEEPKVPNFVSSVLLMRDIELRQGMVLAVEPMVNMGSAKVECLSDGWTVCTADGRPSAHFEHTLAVTDDGVSVLT